MKKIFLFISAISILSGCDKFLDKAPDNRTDLNTQSKIAEILTSAYPQTNYIAMCEIMSDNAAEAEEGEPNRNLAQAFFWSDNYDTEQEDTPLAYWHSCYRAIAAANMALQAIEKIGGCTPQKGEALVARAYAHFMLVNLYAKFRDPVTMDTDPGIPYVTEPETQAIQQYERGTVASVYRMIEEDMLQGLPLLDDNSYTVPAYHFTKKAGYAFATRYYQYTKNWDKVLEYARKAFPNETIDDALRPWNTTYKSLTLTALLQRFAKATEPANLLLAESQSVWSRLYTSYQYGVTGTKLNVIAGANVTQGYWCYNTYQNYTNGLRFIAKFNEYFYTEVPGANTGYPYIMVPLFSSDEVLFNRAEAYVYLQQYDEAIADLNLFVQHNILGSSNNVTAEKILAFYPSAANLGSAILMTILDFRRVAFIHEGMRWFDILRYKLPVVHTTVDGAVHRLAPDDLRRVWQLPEEVVKSGILLNPR